MRPPACYTGRRRALHKSELTPKNASATQNLHFGRFFGRTVSVADAFAMGHECRHPMTVTRVLTARARAVEADKLGAGFLYFFFVMCGLDKRPKLANRKTAPFWSCRLFLKDGIRL